jgi:histidyl-tRNA synthetase
VSGLAGGETKLRHEFQGVGFSVRLTRLFVVLGRLGKLANGRLAGAQRRILVICRAEEDLERNLSLTAALRKGGIEAMAFQLPKEFHQQLTYAKRNGFTHLLEVLAGEEGAQLLEIQDVTNPTATRRRVDLKSLLP